MSRTSLLPLALGSQPAARLASHYRIKSSCASQFRTHLFGTPLWRRPQTSGLSECAACSACAKGQDYFAGDMCGGMGSGKCDYCEPGTYKDTGVESSWNDDCDPCPTCAEGTYREGCGVYPFSDDGNCLVCPVGWHKNGVGDWDTVCTECAPGACSQQHSTQASHIAPSQYRSFFLRVCAGRYANTTGMAQCYTCDPGSYQPGLGSTACVACEKGFSQSSQMQIVCDSCLAGMFSSATGALSCLGCPARASAMNTHANRNSVTHQPLGKGDG